MFAIVGRFIASLVPSPGTASAATTPAGRTALQQPRSQGAIVRRNNNDGTGAVSRRATRLIDGDDEWEDYDSAFAQAGFADMQQQQHRALLGDDAPPSEDAITTLTVRSLILYFMPFCVCIISFPSMVWFVLINLC